MLKKIFLITFLCFCLAVPSFASLTIDNCQWISLGNARMRICQVDFDSSYYTSGEPLDYTAYGFLNVFSVIAEPKGGYDFTYDYTNKVLRAYTAGSEASPGTDLSALTNIRVIFFGR